MLLGKFLPKFSLLESACSSCSLLLNRSVAEPRSYWKPTGRMGCSISKGANIPKTEAKKRSLPMSTDSEFVEDVVCRDSDIREKEMKVFNLQDAGQVLLIRQNGKLSAIGNKCTHYGAPLEEGALGDGRVRCQWHGACFNIATGDIEDFPGLDSLPCYQVTVENNNVKVRARRSDLATNKRVKAMAKKTPAAVEHYIVIGGGPSGAICVETLRQEGFQGKITLIARENYLPYDRIKVNKNMDVQMENIQLRKPEFYAENNIEVKLGCDAIGVDPKEKKVKLCDGSDVSYDALYIATGSEARKAEVLGAHLKNVVVLREYEHAVAAQRQLGPNKHVVVLGSSFIGMEAAAYCVDKVEKVTVVSKDTVPFQAALGSQIGEGVMKMFQEQGIHFVTNSGLKRCIDNGCGAVGSVELLDGTILKADICIMGIGSIFNTSFLKDSGILLKGDGSVDVNEYLQTNFPNVFAGGDIAYAPVWARGDVKAAIGHYGLAQYHGRMAALNMLHKQQPLRTLPFFWTMLFGKPIRYAGYGKYDDIIYTGNPTKLDYVAFFLKGDDVVAISECGSTYLVAKYAEYVSQGNRLHRKDLEEGDPLAWSK